MEYGLVSEQLSQTAQDKPRVFRHAGRLGLDEVAIRFVGTCLYNKVLIWPKAKPSENKTSVWDSCLTPTMFPNYESRYAVLDAFFNRIKSTPAFLGKARCPGAYEDSDSEETLAFLQFLYLKSCLCSDVV